MQSPYGLETVERCEGCRRREARGFCNLPAEALRALEAVKFTALYPRGALLFIQGQPTRGVYVLCSGRVKLSATSTDARVIITRIARAGEILGLCATLSGEAYEVTAETLEPCQVNFVRAADFMRFLSTHAEASLRAAEQLGRNYSAALEQVRMLGLSHSAAAKLARFLLEAGGADPEGSAGEDRKKLALTHEEIGQLIGASRETVTRLFTEFKQEKLIQVKGAVLQLDNRPALEALANY
ncbi:MAG TPA: Crp/Fnr family transcriptional regulator [Pyrinomonadaceae bacterium]|nr:Crp/Fnr family transcriptional regulator [Pyrinomonadaceae bacterium]